MTKAEIIEGLEYCIQGCTAQCEKCPYRVRKGASMDTPACLDDCQILPDILAMLKEDTP